MDGPRVLILNQNADDQSAIGIPPSPARRSVVGSPEANGAAVAFAPAGHETVAYEIPPGINAQVRRYLEQLGARKMRSPSVPSSIRAAAGPHATAARVSPATDHNAGAESGELETQRARCPGSSPGSADSPASELAVCLSAALAYTAEELDHLRTQVTALSPTAENTQPYATVSAIAEGIQDAMGSLVDVLAWLAAREEARAECGRRGDRSCVEVPGGSAFAPPVTCKGAQPTPAR
jgi:hypothetical protein